MSELLLHLPLYCPRCSHESDFELCYIAHGQMYARCWKCEKSSNWSDIERLSKEVAINYVRTNLPDPSNSEYGKEIIAPLYSDLSRKPAPLADFAGPLYTRLVFRRETWREVSAGGTIKDTPYWELVGGADFMVAIPKQWLPDAV